MVKSSFYSRSFRIAAILAVISSGFAVPSAFAADRKPPTKPSNLRTTSVSAHNIALAWNPSTDNSGVFTYKVWVSYGFTYTLPQSQTTFSLGVVPGSTYSFFVYAVDGSGNTSSRSNTLTVTAPADVTPPTAPMATLVAMNPTEAFVEWTASTDDGPHIFYTVFVNGVEAVDARQQRYAVVHGLSPETTYEITVKARDLYGGNFSPPSNVLLVTTAAVSAEDSEPPTVPTGFFGYVVDDGAREINLFWTESFDNQTPQASIMYEVYMNGVLDHATTGDRAVLYATQGGENVFTLIALDRAGNRSEPVSITVFTN
jgi:chitodextrinase